MKNLFSRAKWALSAVLVAGLFLAACKKSGSDDNNTQVAALMAFNLAPDKPAVGMALSGNYLTGTPLAFKSYTGVYLPIFPGTRTLDAFDYYSGNTFASETFSFEPEKYYSAFTVGANDNYQNVIVQDDFDALSATSGQAYIRYINAIPDSSNPLVTIAANGSNVVNESAAFTSVSGFTGVTPGDVTITVSNSGTIDVNRTISLEAMKVYTVLLAGLPGSTDTDKEVQIRYVENGSLTDDANAGGRTSSSGSAVQVK